MEPPSFGPLLLLPGPTSGSARTGDAGIVNAPAVSANANIFLRMGTNPVTPRGLESWAGAEGEWRHRRSGSGISTRGRAWKRQWVAGAGTTPSRRAKQPSGRRGGIWPSGAARPSEGCTQPDRPLLRPRRQRRGRPGQRANHRARRKASNGLRRSAGARTSPSTSGRSAEGPPRPLRREWLCDYRCSGVGGMRDRDDPSPRLEAPDPHSLRGRERHAVLFDDEDAEDEGIGIARPRSGLRL